MRFPLLALAFFASLQVLAAEKMLVFVGTYTGGPSKGIYSYEFDPESGSLKPIGLAAETPSPSFLAISPNKHFLYAVNEVDRYEGEKAGSVTGFKIDPATAKLTRINDATSGGPGPCHLSVDKTGRFVLVANYGGGSVEVLPIDEQGKLGKPATFIQHTGSSVNQQRQGEPHAHSINLDPDNRHAIVADLGLDKLLVYRFDAATGTLTPNDSPFCRIAPGSGPRHFAFHPNGKDVYLINEMLCTVTALTYSAQHGTFSELQTIRSIAPGPGMSTAEIEVHPSGHFVYGSNRGHDSITVFSVGPDGRLTRVENESTRGKTPRNFSIDPSGKFLIAANQDSDTLAVFKIDQKTGALDPVGETVAAPKPVCVAFFVR